MNWVKTIDVAGRSVRLRELTVADIRAWLAAVETRAAESDLVGLTLFADMALDDLVRMTDLTADDLEAMTPSALAEVAAAVREVNAGFFAMRGRWIAPVSAPASSGSTA